MSYTIVLGNKLSSVSLHQNHTIVFMLIRNLDMTNKNMWDGAEEPTIYHIYTIDNRKA